MAAARLILAAAVRASCAPGQPVDGCWLCSRSIRHLFGFTYQLYSCRCGLNQLPAGRLDANASKLLILSDATSMGYLPISQLAHAGIRTPPKGRLQGHILRVMIPLTNISLVLWDEPTRVKAAMHGCCKLEDIPLLVGVDRDSAA